MTAALARDLAAARTLEDAERVHDGARAILPRSALIEYQPRPVPPVAVEGEWLFDNGFVRATVRETGAIAEITTARGRNVVSQANLLSASLGRWPARIRREPAEPADGGLDVRFRLKKSALSMHLVLYENEPFLQVELAAHWHERWTQLHSEHWLALDTRDALTTERYARATASDGTGLAILSAEPRVWQRRALRRGGVHLRAPLPRGEFRFAYAPYEQAPRSALERAWEAFVHPGRVPLFESDDESVIVVRTRPLAEAEGVSVSVRECDGGARRIRLRCAGRAKSATSEDAGEVLLEDGALVFDIGPLAERSFHVLF